MMTHRSRTRWTSAARCWVLVALLANLLLAGGLPAAAQGPNPHFVAWSVEDQVAGWEWQPDASVTVTVDTFSGTADTDEWGNFHLSLDGFDLQNSHTITVQDGVSTKTHTVTELAVDQVNPVADTVSGRAAAGSEVSVYAACDEHACYG